MYATALWIAALTVTAIAAVTDSRSGRIPNWLTGAGLLFAVGAQSCAGKAGLVLGAAGLVCSGLVPAVVFFATRGQALGGGDVKLFAVLGALLGPMAGLEVQLLSYCALLCFALCLLAFRGVLWRTLKGALALALRRVLPAQRAVTSPVPLLTSMRMGPSILVACAVVAAYRNFPGLQLWL